MQYHLFAMILKHFYMLVCLSLVLVSIFAVYNNISWLTHVCELMVLVSLLLGLSDKLEFKNLNFLVFLNLCFLAVLLQVFENDFASNITYMLSYLLLMWEAFRHIRRKFTNVVMFAFIFLLAGINLFFIFQHIQDLKIYMTGVWELVVYTFSYINLLILALVALFYYLHSYSEKSIFFLIGVLSLVLSDILRDITFFYLPDLSILLMESLLNFCAIILSFKFFATEEKKLSLFNLD